MEDLRNETGSMRQRQRATALPRPGAGKGLAEHRALEHQVKAGALGKAQALSERLLDAESEWKTKQQTKTPSFSFPAAFLSPVIAIYWLKLAKGELTWGLGHATYRAIPSDPQPTRRTWGLDLTASGRGRHTPILSSTFLWLHSHPFPTTGLLLNLKIWNFRIHAVTN